MDVYVQMYTLLVFIVFLFFFLGGGGSDVPKNSCMQALFVKEQGRQ